MSTLPNLQPSSLGSAKLAPPDDADDINFLQILDVVLDHRWLIATVTALGLALGIAYALISTPIYEANTLIQVEESKGSGVDGLLGETASLFEIRSPASAEMEILRSRLVVGQAVANLQLDISVTPDYLPVIGRWLARRATQPSNPGFLGMGGYISGNEVLKVTLFEVPAALEGQEFSAVLTAQGFELRSPLGASLGQGTVGESFEFEVNGQKGKLLVAAAVGKPGATFHLVRFYRLGVTESLQNSMLITEQGRQSGVIRASVEGNDPVKIARVMNEIGALYVRQNVERKAAEAEKTLGFLGTFLPELRRQLEESEKKFNQFRNENSTFDLGVEAKIVLDQLVQRQTSLIELQQKRKELEARFTAQHPIIQTIDTQIRSLTGELATLTGKVKTFPNIEQDLLRLMRDLKVNTELYVELLNSSQQLRLVKEGKVGNVRVVDVAAVPVNPVKPKRAIVVATAAVLGLLSGLALALMRNSLRPGIRDPADIETHVGIPVFASLPHSEVQTQQAKAIKLKSSGTHVLAVASPQDPTVESLRSLRTALQFAMLDSTSNVVVMTGPTPSIGKSFASVNFAAVLGAASKKVLLIDGDLRKGHLNQYFGQGRDKGLSEVLSGTVALADAIRRNVVPNVDFLSTGTLPPNPAELLMTPTTQVVVKQAASLYDLVIIDTAPVLAASDTSILAPLAGAVFLVARAEISTLGELQEAVKRLAQSGAQARGVIFNDLNTNKRRYSYGLGYKYGRYRYTNYQY